MEERRQYLQIEGLRFFGLLLVILYHYGFRYFELYGGECIPILKNAGAMGVGIFFSISACMALKTDNNQMASFVKMLGSYIKKLYKLWIPYVLAISIIYIFLAIFPLEGRETTCFDYVLNIFWINGFIGTKYVDSAHWYMTYQICLIWMACLLKYLKIQYKQVVYFTWIILSFVLMLVSVNNIWVMFIISRVSLLLGGKYAGCIVAGFVVMMLYKKKGNVKWNSILIVLAILHTLYYLGVETALVCGAVYIVEYLCLNNKINILQSRIFVKIGGLSYFIYLIHQNIGYCIMNNLGVEQLLSLKMIIVGLVIAVVSIILKVISNKLLSKK